MNPYYGWLKSQPCVRCGTAPEWSALELVLYGQTTARLTEVAHVRAVYSQKTGLLLPRRKGIAEFSAIPLCSNCHQHSPDAIHKIGEAKFFEALGKEKGYLVATYLAMFLDEEMGRAS